MKRITSFLFTAQAAPSSRSSNITIKELEAEPSPESPSTPGTDSHLGPSRKRPLSSLSYPLLNHHVEEVARNFQNSRIFSKKKRQHSGTIR